MPMYVTVDTIIKIGSLLGALVAIVGAIIAVYKVVENNKRQNKVIEAVQEEQTILCYGMKGALQGLIEQGCNGPCKEALAKLDKHLNQKAHEAEL